MDIELDALDDIFADEKTKNARPVGKFQPKLKKKGSATAKVPVETAKPLEDDKKELVSGSESLSCENDLAKDKNTDVIMGLDSLGDSLPHTSTDMDNSVHPTESVSKDPTIFSQNVDNVPVANLNFSVDKDPLPAVDHSFSTDKYGASDSKESGREDIDIIDSIHMSTTSVVSAQKPGKFKPKPKAQKQNMIHEASVSIPNSLGSESVPPEVTCQDKDSVPMDIIDSIDMSTTAVVSAQKHGKFKPKPKSQELNMIHEASLSVPNSLGSESVPPKVTFQDNDSVPTSQDDVNDLSSLGLARTSPCDDPLNDESPSFMEANHLNADPLLGCVPEIPAKLATRRAKTGNYAHIASDPASQQPQTPSSNQDSGIGRSLRPRKSNQSYSEFVNEAEEEVLGNEQSNDEFPNSANMDEENIYSEDLFKDNESPNMAKNGNGKENPAKKRKAKETSDQDKAKKPRKFSHSTRRRRVDKALLEIPDYELDHQKIPLRDLILLAEYKERQKKKDAAGAATASELKQSNGTSTENYNEDETFISRQDGDYDDAEPSQVIKENADYFNYHTFMDRTPTIRWSKQETELFYEAIQQFGTDLSMIQQLFPGRTRHQVKLKYKKEERQHPQRLREALTSRSTNHSHFQKVIEHLKQLAAEKEKQDAENEESVDLSGDDEVAEEENRKDSNEEAKHEHSEEKENENVARGDAIEPERSSLKADEFDEDDDSFWNQYKGD